MRSSQKLLRDFGKNNMVLILPSGTLVSLLRLSGTIMHGGMATMAMVWMVTYMIKNLLVIMLNLMLNQLKELMVMNNLWNHLLQLEPMCAAVLDRHQVIVAVSLTNEALDHQRVLLIDRCSPPWWMSFLHHEGTSWPATSSSCDSDARGD